MPLDGPLLPSEWTAELNYLANSDGSMTLALDEGPETKVPVHPGLNRVFVRLPGAGDAITVRAATAALSVCLASGPVGYLAPDCDSVGPDRPACAKVVRMSNLRDDGLNVFREMLPGVLPDDLPNEEVELRRRFRAGTDGDRHREHLRPAVVPRGAVQPGPQPGHAGHPDRAGRRAEMESHFRIAKQNGLTEDELAEVVYHASGYAGFPAAQHGQGGGREGVPQGSRNLSRLGESNPRPTHYE